MNSSYSPQTLWKIYCTTLRDKKKSDPKQYWKHSPLQTLRLSIAHSPPFYRIASASKCLFLSLKMICVLAGNFSKHLPVLYFPLCRLAIQLTSADRRLHTHISVPASEMVKGRLYLFNTVIYVRVNHCYSELILGKL